MMFSFTVDQTHNLPAFFYLFSYVVTYAFFVWMALKREYPLYPYLTIFLTMSLFAIIGGKLFSYSLSDWQQVIYHFNFPITVKKRVFGYLLFGLVGYGIAKRALKFDRKTEDILVYGATIHFAVTKLGCLFGGCCYGIPTGASWGIRYGENFPAYFDQFQNGLISGGSQHSLWIHPTQVYEMIAAAAIIFLLQIAVKKHFFKRGFNLVLYAIILFSGLRFVIEFFRAGGEVFYSLKPLQWAILGLITCLTILIRVFEHKKGTSLLQQKTAAKYPQVLFAIFLVSAIAFTGFQSWLSPLERLVTFFIMTFLILCLIFRYLQYQAIHQPIKIFTLVILLPLFLLSQRPEEPGDSLNTAEQYYSLGFGGMYGREEQICGGYKEYSAGGIDLGYHFKDSKSNEHSVSMEIYNIKYDGKNYFGISPFYEINRTNIGVGLGANYSPYRSNGKERDLYPRAGLRLGPRDGVFLDGHYSNHLPSGLPQVQLSLGFGLPTTNFNPYGNYVRLGITEAGYFLNPRFNLNKQVIIDPFFQYGNDENFQAAIRFYILFNK